MAVTAAQIKKVVSVASGIIYAQEGNYSSVNKNDNKHGMSIGKCQWNAYWGRALPLLQTIANANKEKAKELLGETLYNEITSNKANFWDKKERAATEEEAKALSNLLQTEQGKKAQDDLANADITQYIKNGVKVGVVSLKALAYYSDLENQGGSGTSKRVAENAGNGTGGIEKVGLEEIHAEALKDSVMGQYASRRKKVYEAVKASTLADVKNTATETKTETTTDTATTTLNGSNSLQKGDIVTFIGGGVYKSSTAENVAIRKDVLSTCKVTDTNVKGRNAYHLISQDGKGVYGWVKADSIKELSKTTENGNKNVKQGDIVTFIGGGVYKSSTAQSVALQKNVTSTCRVTNINEKGTHPYHCISTDGKGVYGWVDKKSIQ